jgi:hypothetical protein
MKCLNCQKPLPLPFILKGWLYCNQCNRKWVADGMLGRQRKRKELREYDLHCAFGARVKELNLGVRCSRGSHKEHSGSSIINEVKI